MPRALLAVIVCCASVACVDRGEVLTKLDNQSDAAVAGAAKDVSCGDGHCAAAIGGAVYLWGQNDQGQLGSGDGQNRLSPVLLQGSKSWQHVASGSGHTCALNNSGQVYCWGSNSRGQLGQGDRAARAAPALVTLPQPATQISSKFNHACALLVNAGLYCWGQNDEGQLGQSDVPPSGDAAAADALSPVPVGSPTWRFTDTGQGHTCAINIDGSLWCWGRNSDHELGDDSRIQVREPLQVMPAGPWLNVAAGQNHTCGVMQDFTLWCWGSNTGSDSNAGFPLGISGVSQVSTPTQVGTATNWSVVRTNTFHTCALDQNANLLCFGRNIEGQLGAADTENRPTPVRVASDVAHASVGRFTTCAIDNAGNIRCAGANDVGQLGTGDTERRDVFTSVSLGAP